MNTYDIEMTATYVGERTDPEGWAHHRWDILLQRDGRQMELPFKMGIGLVDPPKRVSGRPRRKDEFPTPRQPTLSDILESLISDCSIVENDEIDDILDNLPYSKARRLADALTREVADVKQLLGRDYEAFWTQEVYS